MANPFLVLGGIAVGVVTATFGILSVNGWVASAHDAAAINDLAQVAAVQASAASQEGKYLTSISELEGGRGIEMSRTAGVELALAVSENKDEWCAVALSQSGTYFSRSSATSKPAEARTLTDARTASCEPEWTWAADGDALGGGAAPEEPSAPSGWADGVSDPMNVMQPQGAAVITSVTWKGPTSADPNQMVCAITSITGASATPAPWSVTFDRTTGPFGGASAFHNNGNTDSSVTYTEGEGILTVTGKADGTPFNPAWQNRQISSADEMTFHTCATQRQAPSAAPADWVNITQTRAGTWTATQACINLTATGVKPVTEVGVRYGWESNLDLREAFAHIRASGKRPSWIGLTPTTEAGIQYTLDPGTATSADEVYKVTSGWKTSLLGTESKSIKACVNGN